MKELLAETFLGNTLRQYFLTAIIIAAIILFKKYIAHYLSALVYKLFNKRWRTLDKSYLQQYLTAPLGAFVAVLVSVIALDKLVWPPQYNFTIYRISIQEVFTTIGSFLIIFTFFRALIKLIDFAAMLLKQRYIMGDSNSNHQILFFSKDLIKVFVGLLGALLILKYAFNYDIKGLLTGLSIVGAAIALALRQSLENLIASFIIFFDKPFQSGDLVKLNNFSGTIENIGLRSTRIRSDAKTYITVPNSKMADSILDNLSNRTQRRADLKLEIDPRTAPEKVQKLLDGLKTIFSSPDVQNFNLYLTDISATAIIISCDYYTAPVDFNTFSNIRQRINLQALQLLDVLNILVSGSYTDIKISEPPPAPEKPII